MITITINRLTGERKVVETYSDPADDPLEATAGVLAKMIIEHGLLEQFKAAN